MGHYEGQAVFVPGTAPGDVADVRIVKPMKGYAFGRMEKLLISSPDRIPVDCPVAGPCGGCGLRHMEYKSECEAKTHFVRDAFSRLGKLDVPVLPALPAPSTDRYRNKVQLPVGEDESGHL
ncbi:TRAM domain-containing protein, partial [Gemmiger formicilis]|uniref:TRAM domain-containing protein n=1 Tax=Gemmiger formicilis TaxID=745368 RepID=UPI0031F6EBB4